MQANPLIVMATFWNEKEWVSTALRQIDQLNPSEVFICDGCFDSRYPNGSTDGTREIVEEYVAARPHAKMVAAERVTRFAGVWKLWLSHNKNKWFHGFTPARIKALYLGARSDLYRVNQAITFQKMISLSKCWQPGWWFMTLDADQFYSEEVLAHINSLSSHTAFDLLTAKERTFFHSFDEFTEGYEGREFNNMPHKILPGTSIMPTRDIVLESFALKRLMPANFMKSDRYIENVVQKKAGFYNHYKFRQDNERDALTYMVGDRKPPDLTGLIFEPYVDQHPEAVRDHKSRYDQ